MKALNFRPNNVELIRILSVQHGLLDRPNLRFFGARALIWCVESRPAFQSDTYRLTKLFSSPFHPYNQNSSLKVEVHFIYALSLIKQVLGELKSIY